MVGGRWKQKHAEHEETEEQTPNCHWTPGMKNAGNWAASTVGDLGAGGQAGPVGIGSQWHMW